MSKITLEQLQEMIALQDSMNNKVDPNWKTNGRDWHLAAQMELHEGIEHFGYKWWKKQTPDLPQVQLEVVDAWHFWLSDFIEEGFGEDADELDALLYDINIPQQRTAAVIKKEKYISFARDYGNYFGSGAFGWWAPLLATVDLTPKDLYEMYIKKNVLNMFRQNNGYKEGTYIKEWNGEEDNVHLLRLAKEGDNFTQIYLRLEDYYKSEVLK